MSYRLRAFRDDDYDRIRRLADAAVPWDQVGNRRWLLGRRHFPEAQRTRRHYIAEDTAGHSVGYGAVEQQAHDSGVYRMFLVCPHTVLMKGVGDLLYERLDENLRDLDATAVFMMEHLRDGPLLDFLKARGFAVMPRRIFWESILWLRGFNPATFSTYYEAVEGRGVQLLTLEEECKRNPNCLYDLYDLFNLLLDKPVTVKELRHRLEQPDVLPECFFIARDGDQYVGLCGLALDLDPDYLVQAWTGVHPLYRQRGIATALRVKTAAAAKERGYRGILTFASVLDVAMLALDERTGFTRRVNYVVLQRDLEEPD